MNSVATRLRSHAAGDGANLKHTIDSLQAGRGIAALAVVLLHSALAARSFGGAFAGYSALSYGYLGVDFFFVLSGFIIYHSTVGRGRSATYFATARFRRVYLPYLPIGIGLALAYVMYPHISAGNRDWSWLPTLTLAPVDSHPALSVAWTLQHEVLFYAVFGLFYFSGLLPLGLAVWTLCILLIGRHLPFEAINLEFLFGIASAILYRARLAHPAISLLAPVLLIAWIAVGADETHRILVGAAFSAIVAPLAQRESKGLRVPSALVQLGGASYSLYLVHNPIVSVVARLVHGSWTILFASVAASLVGGFGYHALVERHVVTKKTNPEVFAAP